MLWGEGGKGGPDPKCAVVSLVIKIDRGVW